VGALLLASFIAGAVMLLNLWVAYGPAGSMKLSADRNVLTFFGAAATFGIAMAIAEQFARLSERRQLWPSLAGGVAAFALAFGLWGGAATFVQAQADRSASVVVMLVAFIGGFLGLVHFTLGNAREPRRRDDPEDIVRALAEQALPAEAPAPPPLPARPRSAFMSLFDSSPASGPALVEAGDKLYFAGPLQVRTSYGALFFSGALVGMLMILATLGLMAMGSSLGNVERRMSEFAGVSRSAIAAWLIFGTLGTSALLFVPNLIAHQIARWMKVTSVGGYAGIGFMTAIILCFVLPPLGMIALFPTPIAMAVYRRIVGIGPVDLPSDIVVENRDALIAADHPRRRYRRVLVQE
jgi:hypothetical protein